MKRFLALSIVVVLFLTQASAVPVSATDNMFAVDGVYANLYKLANEYIVVTECESPESAETVYSNLQSFFCVAREHIPALTDEELADFVTEYVQLGVEDKAYNVLDILLATEVVVTTQFVKVTESGVSVNLTLDEATAFLAKDSKVSPLNTWEDDDGLMQIEYRAIRYAETSDGVPYFLCATFNWLTIPTMLLTDTTAIAYTGQYDDSYRITSDLKYSAQCGYCDKNLSIQEKEIYSDGRFTDNSEYIELDFTEANAIGAKIDIRHISCFHNVDASGLRNYAVVRSISSYIGFQVIVTEIGQMKPAYAHTTIGFSVDIGASTDGNSVTVDFLPGIFTNYIDFVGAPITLRIS